jgi:23S rRNA maturation mini-RNase III
MQYVTLQNTQKKEKVNDMPLAGYVGEQVYSGYFRKYPALLQFMAEVGVGNETVYGLGKYETKMKN